MKVLEISKQALNYNLDIIKNKVNYPETKIIAVVKANAMGLGLIEFVKFLLENGINTFAVSNTIEAIALRDAGNSSEIQMLSEVSNEDEIRALIEKDIILTIGNLEEKEKIDKIAKEFGKKVKAQIKIDTGFARFGFIYNDDSIFEAIKSLYFFDK